jgi:Na+-transporting NADH:ubiquinone oxidoreductase subunit A
MGQRHVITKGLNLPIKGQPDQVIQKGADVQRVAVVADDYPFMKAKMLVNVGDQVKRGQRLFEDRKNAGVFFTAPGAGEIIEINRGERRKLISVVIQLNDTECSGNLTDTDYHSFENYQSKAVDQYSADEVRSLLIESGLWTTLRVRPMSQVPAVDAQCEVLFITAIDTHPLAAKVESVLDGKREDFKAGLQILSALCQGTLFVCQGEESDFSSEVSGLKNASLETFVGDHPAGLVGTHIHTLYPVSRKRSAWHLGYQDVVSIGRLFQSGKIDVERVISVAGPGVLNPVLLQTRQGAEVAPLLAKNTTGSETRWIDGSVFYGRVLNTQGEGYLGRYRQQITILLEGRERVFFGWLQPGGEKFSVSRAFFSSLMSGEYGARRLFNFTTTTHGSHRAMVPIGMFEKVMPLDMMPTFLLRALVKDDLERAEALGCLELDEEDLSLCTFVSPGKEDYGPALRRTLTTIWKEG